MSDEAKIRQLEVASNSLYRTQTIRFTSNKSITTPTKTIPLDKIKLKHSLNSESRQLNEIFKRFSAQQIKEANEDNDKFHKLETWFNSQKNKIPDNTSTLCFLDFNEKRIPTNEEIEFITDISYCNSDITSIPTINHFNIPKQEEIAFEDYKKYLENVIQVIDQLNNKPIMGIIPKLAPKKVEELLCFYQEKGINCFALDLAGSNPISASMRIFKVLKILNKMRTLDNSYIHGHNVGMRVNKTVDVIPAKDILGFGIGLGSLGEKRTIFRPNPAFISYIQTNPMNKFRLFNKEDYGYWKSISVEELEKVYPKDSALPIKLFNNPSQMNYVQKVFNAEQLALESHIIKKIISETPDKSLSYVRKKRHVAQDDIKLLEKGQKKIK